MDFQIRFPFSTQHILACIASLQAGIESMLAETGEKAEKESTNNDIIIGEDKEKDSISRKRRPAVTYGKRNVRRRHIFPHNSNERSGRDYRLTSRARSTSSSSNSSNSSSSGSTTNEWAFITSSQSQSLVTSFPSVASLLEIYQDVLLKCWFIPYVICCGATDEKLASLTLEPRKIVLQRRVLSLVEFCAFSLGNHIHKARQNNSSDIKLLYKQIPNHLRRFVLMQHTTSLLLSLVHTESILIDALFVLDGIQSKLQVMAVAKHIVLLHPIPSRRSLWDCFLCCVRLNMASEFLQLLIDTLHHRHLQSSTYIKLAELIGQETFTYSLSVAMIRVALQYFKSDPNQQDSPQLSNTIDKRIRSNARKWTIVCITESLAMSSYIRTNPSNYVQGLLCNFFKIIDLTTHDIENVSKHATDVSYPILIRALQIETTNLLPDRLNHIIQLISHIKLHSPNAFALVASFKSLKNIHSLVLLLQGHGLFSHALVIAERLVDLYDIVSKTKSMSVEYTLDDLKFLIEQLLKAIELNDPIQPKSSQWYFEPLLDAWVEGQPSLDTSAEQDEILISNQPEIMNSARPICTVESLPDSNIVKEAFISSTNTRNQDLIAGNKKIISKERDNVIKSVKEIDDETLDELSENIELTTTRRDDELLASPSIISTAYDEHTDPMLSNEQVSQPSESLEKIPLVNEIEDDGEVDELSILTQLQVLQWRLKPSKRNVNATRSSSGVKEQSTISRDNPISESDSDNELNRHNDNTIDELTM